METVINTRIAESEEKMETVINMRITESEEKMESMIIDRIREVENVLLEEMDRTQRHLEDKINLVKEDLEELKQYYKITKLENDNTALLLKMIGELERRVKELEKRTA